MLAGKKTLLNVSTALMGAGSFFFLISFSTTAWSRDYSVQRQGIWRECISQINGKYEVYALCRNIEMHGWVRGVQFFETVAFMVLVADIGLALYRFHQGPTTRLTTIQMALNFVAAVLILLGVVIQGSATPLPKPGYSFYLALFSVAIYVIAGIVNVFEKRYAKNYIMELDEDPIFGISQHTPPTRVQGVALVH